MVKMVTMKARMWGVVLIVRVSDDEEGDCEGVHDSVDRVNEEVRCNYEVKCILRHIVQ